MPYDAMRSAVYAVAIRFSDCPSVRLSVTIRGLIKTDIIEIFILVFFGLNLVPEFQQDHLHR